MAESSVFKIALLQTQVLDNVDDNLTSCAGMVENAKLQGANIAVLPEMFCCPYNNVSFVKNAEKKGDRIHTALSKMAKDNNIILVGGSMPERDGDKLFNTCFVFDNKGKQIARHRKAHMCDIDIEGGQHFRESAVFTPGKGATVFDSPFGKIGVCICYDIRFPEMFRDMVKQGVTTVIAPSAFNMTTGPMHWMLLNRARAVDNQIYMLSCAPATDMNASYVSYAHSMAVNPWGQVMIDAGTEPGVSIVELDRFLPISVRLQIPVGNK